MPKVYNKHHRNAPEDVVYIGRPSRWGNPFSVDENRTRERALQLFEEYLERHHMLRSEVKKELKGRDLLCFCSPLPCHGDILLKVANEEDNVRG